MKQNLLFSTICVLTLSACVQTAPDRTPQLKRFAAPVAHSENVSYSTARNRVHSRVGELTRLRQARNVILFVGDGMGVSTVTAARIFQGQSRGESGEENYLSYENFPYTALSKTYNTDLQVPDSAGTMTAMMTGLKTRAGVINIGPENPQGNCVGAAENRALSFLELAEDNGLATGVISTARITHATPAATFAHSAHRNWEVDVALPKEAKEAGCTDIASQLVNFSYGDGIEVILGGGRQFFLPDNRKDPENEDKTGARQDGWNLVEEWQRRNPRGAFVWNDDQFRKIKPDEQKNLLGLFEQSHMQFEADRMQDPGGEPSLAEMTAKAIALLAQKPNGFFLMVEGGRIDHAHHGGNAYRALTDAVAFSDAVAVADRMTEDRDTLILVTADHSHTMTINGYPRRGNPILGKVVSPDGTPQLDSTGLAYTTLTYANGPGFSEERVDLIDVDTKAADYRQLAAFPLASETHGGEDVAVYAKGPGADLMRGVIEQNEIFHVMLEASILGNSDPIERAE